MKKIFILSFFLLLLTGCTATYNIEIYNDKVKEDMSFVEKDSNKWNSVVEYELTYDELVSNFYEYPYPIFYGTVVDEDPYIKLKNVKYYTSVKINNDLEYGGGLKYNDFNINEYVDSNIVKECYDYFNVIDEDDSIFLSTSKVNKCFDEYPLLDNITINLKTNHKVLEHNADSKNGYHYSWTIDKSEKDNAAIYIRLDKKHFVFNYENEFFKRVFIILVSAGIISLVGGTIYVFFNSKNKKINKI